MSNQSEPVMTIKEAKAILEAYVEDMQGTKATELCSSKQLIIMLKEFNIPELLEQLVTEHRVVEVEYTLPSMSYKVKSFYLPKGTVVRILGDVPI